MVFYQLLKQLLDPLTTLLVLTGISLWVLRDLRKKNKTKHAWWTLVACACLLYLLSIRPSVSFLAYFLEKEFIYQDLKKAEIDIVVVLGGGILRHPVQPVYGPSKETSSRLLSGLRSLRYSKDSLIILSGTGEKESEAEVMATIAQELRINKANIMIESNSRNTWEHAVEINKLLNDKDMRIGLVTSALHMKRSLMAFRRYFNNLIPLPSGFVCTSKRAFSVRSLLPNSWNLYICKGIIHEVLGIAWYAVKG
ncbi:YdcF family protein [Fibrobacterota bacterium]